MRTPGGISGQMCYMEDSLMFVKDNAGHMTKIRQVLRRLQEAGVASNPK